jgi:glutamate:GABA antiporter
MATRAGQQDVLISERVAGGILPQVLNSFDMVAIFVAIVLFISNSAVVTGAGAAAYIFWIAGFITFLIPGAIVTGQLGLMFPGEGSIYVWTHKAFGKFWGFFAGFCAWWPGVLVMVATGDAVVTLLQQLGSNHGLAWLVEPWQQGVVILIVLACSMVLSWLRFRVTQNWVNIVFVAYGGAILLVGLAGLFWLINGNPPHTDFHSAASWTPSPAKWTFYGLVILALLGIEVPLNMGVEIRSVRSITKYLFWGSIVVMAAYLIGTFGVQVAVPAADQGNPSAVAEAVQKGLGPLGTVLGDLVTLIFLGFFLFNTAVYNYSFGRLLFVSGLDRRLPAAMSRVNRNRVPWVAVLVQTVIAALVTLLSFILPYAFAGGGNNAGALSTKVYDVLQAAVTIIWCVSMVLLFVDVVIIRFKYPQQFAERRLAAPWVFYLCSAIGLLASAVGIIVTFQNPWTSLIGERDWWMLLAVIGVASLLVGAIVYFVGELTIGRRTPPEVSSDSAAAPA